jgi:hypothetical protein
LLYGPFKKIENTYKQLKEERLYKNKGETEFIKEKEHRIEFEKKIEPKQDLELIKGIEIESEPKTGKEITEIQRTKVEPEKEIKSEESVEESKQIAPVMETKSTHEVEKMTEVEIEIDRETIARTETMEEIGVEENREHDQETVQEAKSIGESESKLVLEPADIELTVGEILRAYEEDDVTADTKFMNKILRVTGDVSLVDIKEGLNIQYIRLTSGSGEPWQSVQCMFDRKHLAVLEQLEKGQTAIVQGRYNGSVIAIRMIDCVLVSR